MLDLDDFTDADFCELRNMAVAGLLDGKWGCINATWRDLGEDVIELDSTLSYDAWARS
jgi:hypothetical protein